MVNTCGSAREIAQYTFRLYLFCRAKTVGPNKNVLSTVQNTFSLLLVSQQKRKSGANKRERVAPTPTGLNCWVLGVKNIFSQQMRKSLPNTNNFELLGVKNCWAGIALLRFLARIWAACCKNLSFKEGVYNNSHSSFYIERITFDRVSFFLWNIGGSQYSYDAIWRESVMKVYGWNLVHSMLIGQICPHYHAHHVISTILFHWKLPLKFCP